MSEQELEKANPQEETPTEGSEDLLTRVSKFVENGGSEDNPENNDSQAKVGIHEDLKNTIESIDDPALREKFLAMEKSLMSGADKKFQEAAAIRKELELQREQLKSTDTKWTPERIQKLMEDQEFLEAAKAVAGDPQEEDDSDSLLSPQERERVARVEKELAELKKQNAQAVMEQQRAMRENQHAQYEQKYANYDRSQIDIITKDMLEGKIQATPEHIYKAFNHDANVKRAYELGRADERKGIPDKVESASIGGIKTNTDNTKIEPLEGETDQSFWNRIIEKNLKLAKK